MQENINVDHLKTRKSIDSAEKRQVNKVHILQIPLQITPQEKRLYQLKNKSLEGRAKGHLILTLDFLFNPIRSAVRTINPRDPQVMYEPPKFKRQVSFKKYNHIFEQE